MCVFGFCNNRLAQGRSGALFLHVHHHHPVDVNDVHLMAKMCQGSSGGPAHLPRRLRGAQISLASVQKQHPLSPSPAECLPSRPAFPMVGGVDLALVCGDIHLCVNTL